ncbi:MAG: lysylphosphatidylglycerol synthase transmembrane domain-containing protein [Actinomycetota bacterium]
MTRRRLGLAAAAAVAGLALWFGADRAAIGRAGAALADRPLPLVLALGAYTLAFVLRAAAWGPLLPAPVALGRRFRAILAMLAVNHALPGPVGELARARLVTTAGDAGHAPGAGVRAALAFREASRPPGERQASRNAGSSPRRRAPSIPPAPAAAGAGAVTFRAALLSVAAARVVDVGALAVLAMAATAVAGESPAWLRVLAPAGVALPALAWVLARRQGATLTGRQALHVAAWAVPSWALEAGVILVVARAAGVELSVAAALLATCGGVLAQAAAVLPGGVGTYEAGVASVLVPLGVPLGEAVGVAATAHAVKFAFAFGAGGIALAWPRISRPHPRSGPAGGPLLGCEAGRAADVRA